MNYTSINYFKKTNFRWLLIACWIKSKLFNLASKSLPSPIIIWSSPPALLLTTLFHEPNWIIYHYPYTPCSFLSLSFLLLVLSPGTLSSQFIFTCLYSASLTRPSSNAPFYANPSCSSTLYEGLKNLFTKRMNVSSPPIWWFPLPDNNPLKAITALLSSFPSYSSSSQLQAPPPLISPWEWFQTASLYLSQKLLKLKKTDITLCQGRRV